jgi:O-antigen/teichoic acid export membrane protein
MNMTASVNAPIYVSIAIFSPEIVSLLLGPNWTEAASLMRVLALWGLFRSFGNPVGCLLFGLGHARLSAKWNAVLLLITPPVIWYGSQWGSNGMAWSMGLLMAALFVPGWAILIRPTCGLGFWRYSQQVFVPTFCAILAGMFAWVVASTFHLNWLRLLFGLISGLWLYIFLSWILNKEFFNSLRKMFFGMKF